ncbi:MAG: hypothetical protein ACKV2U_13850 [Bryobacteraceae bacterium]
MNQKDLARWLSTAADSTAQLLLRINALEELAKLTDTGLRAPLNGLFKRIRPHVSDKPMDYDPDGAERVVDQYIILAAYKSGDVSLLPELPKLIAQAGDVLEGPENELTNAAKVLRGIGRSEPVQSVAALTSSGAHPHATSNAVRVLQMIGMPNPPTGGSVAVPELDKPVDFTIKTLRQEVEKIAELSEGKIVLSPGAKEFIAKRDFQRGEVNRENRTLASVLTEDLDMLDLTYAVTPSGVVICTFEEAAARWRQRVNVTAAPAR